MVVVRKKEASALEMGSQNKFCSLSFGQKGRKFTHSHRMITRIMGAYAAHGKSVPIVLENLDCAGPSFVYRYLHEYR